MSKDDLKKEGPKWWGHKWRNKGTRNYALHGPNTEIEFAAAKTEPDFRHVGLMADVGSGGDHWLTLQLGLFWVGLYLSIQWHPLSRLWYRFISKQDRRIGLSISNSRLEICCFSIENDYGSEYNWLKDHGCKEENIAKVRQQFWFKLLWRARSGIRYSLWTESFTGYEQFIPKVINPPVRFLWTYGDYYGLYTVEYRYGELAYNKWLGRLLHKPNGLRFEQFKIVHAEGIEESNLPTRRGKGENSWDQDDELCCANVTFGIYRHERMDKVATGNLEEDLKMQLKLSQENLLERELVAFARAYITRRVKEQWARYGQAD